MKKYILIILMALMSSPAFSQWGDYDKKHVSRDTLELVNGITGRFLVSDTTILPLQIFYAQFSSDGTTFYRKYATGRDIWRISTNSQTQWDTIDFRQVQYDLDSIVATGYWIASDGSSTDTVANTSTLFFQGDSGLIVSVVEDTVRLSLNLASQDSLIYYFAQNVGVGGVATYDGNTGTTFNFRSVNNADKFISVTHDDPNNQIDIGFNEDSLAVNAGIGISGGGQFTDGTVTVDMAIQELPEGVFKETVWFAVYDSDSVGAEHRKIQLNLCELVANCDTTGTPGQDSTQYIIVQVCDSTNYAPADTSYTVNYGYLYNWYAAVGETSGDFTPDDNIANTGWHLPTDPEWETLLVSVGGAASAGTALKSDGTTYWLTDNGNDTYNFDLRGAGQRISSFSDLRELATLWTSTLASQQFKTARFFRSNLEEAAVGQGAAGMYEGKSVRLVKDDANNTGTYIGNDGKEYPTVQIGSQVWTAVNIMETKYRSGAAIPNVTDNNVWTTLTIGGYGSYANAESNAGAETITPPIDPTCYYDTIRMGEPINFKADSGIIINITNNYIEFKIDTNYFNTYITNVIGDTIPDDACYIPSGGAVGQVLVKTGAGDCEVAWADPCDVIEACLDTFMVTVVDTVRIVVVEVIEETTGVTPVPLIRDNCNDSLQVTIDNFSSPSKLYIDSIRFNTVPPIGHLTWGGRTVVAGDVINVNLGLLDSAIYYIPDDSYISAYSTSFEFAIRYITNPDYIDPRTITLTVGECTQQAGGTVKYGALYNWYAATDARNIAPEGWHIPTESEISVLLSYLGSGDVAADKMREVGTVYWSTASGATNESGFSGRGSGMRSASTGAFSFIQQQMPMWTSTQFDANTGKTMWLGGNDVNIQNDNKKYGFAIRYIKDNTSDPGYVVGNDGTVYNTVTIGGQVWTSENSVETKYRNGDPIPTETNNGTWTGLTTGARCVYNNDEAFK